MSDSGSGLAMKMGIAFFLILLLFQPVAVKAAAWEETQLVLLAKTGELIHMEYVSEGVDEQKGIRVYRGRREKTKEVLAECSYKDTEERRRLTCSVFDGKPANRIYQSQPRDPANESMAREIYRRHVGDGLESSAGGLGEEVFVCIEGCQKGAGSLIIEVTCAECGMEEEWCYRKYAGKPEKAVVGGADRVDVRKSPSLSGKVVGEIAYGKAVKIVAAETKCVEIKVGEDGGLRVGRWVNVETMEGYPKLNGWVFDISLDYAEK